MATKKEEVVEIRPLDIQRVNIRVVGDTPLIVHAWSEKAKRMMLEAQMKATKTKAKEIRDPYDDFIQSLYWLEGKPEKSTPEEFEKAVKNGAKWGFPVGALRPEIVRLIVWDGSRIRWNSVDHISWLLNMVKWPKSRVVYQKCKRIWSESVWVLLISDIVAYSRIGIWI